MIGSGALTLLKVVLEKNKTLLSSGLKCLTSAIVPIFT
jgi:hypothetical protein